ncbi:hypothetical protein J2Z81_002276 [Virgibacillus campisalis]|uniref:Uncharacterized protein n=1 Tax=Virgibacillus alimentarius TaxID=698769 RepID=A0ABS4SBC8_9BACI|nr:hypothetical protein [Virgibacillus alimentarius]
MAGSPSLPRVLNKYSAVVVVGTKNIKVRTAPVIRIRYIQLGLLLNTVILWI